MSLKSNLIEQIKSRGYLSYEDLVNYCRIWNVKISAAERRLRECEEIEPERNKKGFITGYRERKKQGRIF